MRTINSAGLTLLQNAEGCVLTAYQDVAGIWTIGYGHINGVQAGDICTPDQAAQYLQGDLGDAERFVAAATSSAPTTDNQFAAMVSLCYNVGRGNFRSSSVLRFHLAGDTANAAASFLLWDKAHVDGQLTVVKGLLNRRTAEQTLYLTA